ncbi:myb/SANT-like DNA-binding domain-containing protein 3 isoform X2 [Colias croceus]|uniref:myb/SANT-like DNA-binding domain-containing protein 3 isoform X2 n=1 Tax=Colias crocea TaxID=72248 RepID=UPI001E27B1F4|nr:myb/SANT-like DNA-binding domain-containing protein 3 isoform X2 [Colias croceus]
MSERKRSPNWYMSEKMLLVELVNDHYDIVESKRTDTASMKQKNAGWVKISEEYNSQTNLVHRTAENLKSQWEVLKKFTKRTIRLSMTQTEDGPAKPECSDPLFNRIMAMVSPEGFEHVNVNDTDTNMATTSTEEFEHVNVDDTDAKVVNNKIILEEKQDLQRKKIKEIEMQMRFSTEEREEARKMFDINFKIKQEILKQERIKTSLLLKRMRLAKFRRK